MTDASEAWPPGRRSCGKCCLDRRPEQWLASEFFGRTVNLAGGHRPIRLSEGSRHSRENMGCCRWNGPWLAWLQDRFQKKLRVEGTEPRKLKLESRV